MAHQLRVMLVDDHEVVRAGLRMLVDSTPDMKVIGEAGTAGKAVSMAHELRPDVVVMDVRLTGGASGVEATRDIRAQRPETQVLMLTSFADDEALVASVMAGAGGYVLKQVRGEELLQSIRRLGSGEFLITPETMDEVLGRLRSGKHLVEDNRLARLTPQEERILTLIAVGRTNRQIGEQLHLAEKTVKNYVSSILMKLEVTRRSEAATYYVRHTQTDES